MRSVLFFFLYQDKDEVDAPASAPKPKIESKLDERLQVQKLQLISVHRWSLATFRTLQVLTQFLLS